MTHASEQFDYTKLSVAQRLTLVQDIWDSIGNAAEVAELTKEQRQELERRSEELRHNPNSGLTWPDVKAELLRRRDARQSD